MVNSEVKVSTVEVESVDNMATLPVSRAHGAGADSNNEKNTANKEMELKYVQPKPDKRLVFLSFSSIEIKRGVDNELRDNCSVPASFFRWILWMGQLKFVFAKRFDPCSFWQETY